jgi:hypothetical protein
MASQQNHEFRFPPVQMPGQFDIAATAMHKRHPLEIIIGTSAKAGYKLKKEQGYTAAVFEKEGGVRYLRGTIEDLRQQHQSYQTPIVAFLLLDDTLDAQLAEIAAKGTGFALRQTPFIAPDLLGTTTKPEIPSQPCDLLKPPIVAVPA